ncbi:SMI1/KNR4 family protein [Kitasatospora viridis]|uniref:SUKH superfamily protein n=1 Tax=Kitasatospora viridis TaxID=281105 RepID=A0A561SAC1_9ACTN|nr:SMI1/KNR4 family protein [Kitasatospora viridis]TWF71822.1 SUKH superfamily protein [Kitasatospora viridis]
MSETIEQLSRVLPSSTPGGSKDWASAARKMGIELPRDYREFVDTLGGGYIDGYLYVMEPDCPFEASDLVGFAEERAEALEYLWSSSEDKPGELADAGDRLIAFAMSDNGETAYWLAKAGQAPDEWTIMVNEARGEWWEHYDLSFGQFLLSTLTGELRCEIFSDSFPASPHTFRSFADPSWDE